MRDTGFYINDSYIYGPRGYTRSYIHADASIYYVNRPTGFYLKQDYIYGPEGYTSFYVLNYGIYGPQEYLPWLT